MNQPQTQTRQTLTVKGGANRPKKPFVAKGHDAILKGIHESDDDLAFSLAGDGNVVRGRLIARDKFTITVRFPNGDEWTYFKHAIESFGRVKRQVQ